MKIRNKLIPALTLTFMIVALVSPNSFLLPGSKAARDIAATRAPAAVVVKADLSKQVAQFNILDFAPADPNKQPVKTVPFTAEELKKTGSKRVIEKDGKFFVVTKKLIPVANILKIVPIEDYVAQLNGYEEFLNRFGYSLRSGPADLGKILKLKKKKLAKNDLPGAGARAGGKRFFFDPTIYERNGAVRGVKTYPALKTGAARVNQTRSGINNSQLGQAARMRAVAPREIPLANGSAGTGSRILKTESMCPCMLCDTGEVSFGEDVNKNPVGGDSGGPSSAGSKSLGEYCGEKSGKCKSSACLYDGYLAGQWTGISNCYSATDGNDWFDASLCVDLSSSSCGADRKLNLRNGGSLHSELKIFGFSIPILDIAASASYTDGTTSPESEFKFLGQTVDPIKFVQDIPGPQATFPIGPIPVTISTGLHFEFDVGKPDFTFPTKLNPNACDASDTLNVGVGLNLESHIKLDAAIDAFVAKVGVEGQLILADDYFGVGIKSQISPAKNEVLVTPGLQYRLKHLAGKLFLFAEIDVIVYSKRFEVQIFDFDSGLGTKGQVVTEPFTQKSFGALNLGPNL